MKPASADWLLALLTPRAGDDYTLDRADNDKGYWMDNLNGWVDKEAQAQNRRKRKAREHAPAVPA